MVELQVQVESCSMELLEYSQSQWKEHKEKVLKDSLKELEKAFLVVSHLHSQQY